MKSKILHIKNNLSTDGSSKVIYDLLEKKPENIHFKYLLFEYPDQKILELYNIPHEDVEVISIKEIRGFLKRTFKRILEVKRKVNVISPDIVHFHTDNPKRILDVFSAKLSKQKPQTIFHAHGFSLDFSVRNPFKLTLYRKCIDYLVDSKVSCSAKLGVKMFGNLDGVNVIPSGINTANFNFSETKRKRIREKLGYIDKCVLLHVGRFSVEKNQKFLIEIFDKFLKINPNSVLILVGEGETKNKIKNLIEKYNLQDNIHMFNYSKEIQDFYHISDILVFPSIYEGLGMVPIEAQLMNLKVLASDSLPEETNISNLISYFSLDEGAEEWANKISVVLDAKIDCKNIKPEKIDLNYTSSRIFELYEEGVKKNG